MTAESTTVPMNDLGRFDDEFRAELHSAATRIIDSGWFVMGPEHNALEGELAEFVGVSHAALVGNGTDALVLALRALEVGAGDLVLTCANAGGYSTIATNIVGASAVYADIDADSMLLTLETVQQGVADAVAKHGKAPKCIVVTHLFGASAEVRAITEWAHSQGIMVLEDCAQALGGVHEGVRLGSIGDIATTSFYPTKNLGALGDAGAIFTNSNDLNDRVRSLRQYGWDGKYRNALLGGMNTRCDEMQAAFLRIKLRRLDGWNARRREIHAKYESALNSPSAKLLNSSSNEYVGHLAVLVVEDRDKVMEQLSRQGIRTEIHYPICDHLQSIASTGEASLPTSEWAAEHILSIPLFAELNDAETDRVADALRSL